MPYYKLIPHIRSRVLRLLKRKVYLELWFLACLILLMIVIFLIVEWGFLSVTMKFNRQQFKVNPLDEKSVYGEFHHNLKDDFKLLIKQQSSTLNGALIEKNIARGQVMAIIVENYTPIRHLQKGLEDASIIYEAPAEGGITRFLTIYDNAITNEIGPVRSARPYFITWASELRAGFVHVGGSQAALNNLKSNFRIFNIDEFSDSKTIWRNSNFSAPHNAFTSTSSILERLNREKFRHPISSKRFKFKESDESSGDIHNISIDFSISPYKVKYIYDEKTKTYTRYNGGKTHHNLHPTNIIVQYVDTKVLDDAGRLFIQTNGTGKALVFRDGKVIEGTWEKDSSINSDDQDMSESWTKFFDKNGDEIRINKGQIWIEIVPNGRPVNYF